MAYYVYGILRVQLKEKVAFYSLAVLAVLSMFGCSSSGRTTTMPPKTVSQLGYSITSPAPVGMTVAGIVEVGTGYTSHELYDIRVTLLEVLRGSEVWNHIRVADASNGPPDTGFEYVLARIKFEFNARGAPGNLSHQLTGAQFIALSRDGQGYQATSAVPPAPELKGTLFSGDSVEGWIVLQVPVDDSKPLMTFDASVGGIEAVEHGGDIWFQLY